MCGRCWLDKTHAMELYLWTLDRSTNPKEWTKMSMQFNSVVRTIDPIRNTRKKESDNERKPFNRRTANSSPSAHVNDSKSGSDETNQSAGKKKRLICYRCDGKGHPARLCPSADDCQDVDEVGTEPSSDADSDLFGLDWGDDPIATINSVTERDDRTRGGKELRHSWIPVQLTMYFPSQYVPSIHWRRPPSRRAELVSKEQTGHTSKHYGQRRFPVKTSAGSKMNTT